MKFPSYTFKFQPEAVWFVVVAVATVLLQTLVTTNPNEVTDWHAWVIALVTAAVRAGIGALLHVLTPQDAAPSAPAIVTPVAPAAPTEPAAPVDVPTPPVPPAAS